MLNQYLERLNLLVAKYREEPITQFESSLGKAANFGDLIWYHVDPNSGRRTRFQSGLHGRLGKGSSGSRPEDALPHPYGDLVKVWIIQTLNVRISMSERLARVGAARKFLSIMDGHLYEQNDPTIKSFDIGERGRDRLRPFLEFCAREGLMRKIDLVSSDERDRTGHAAFDISQEKIPDMRSVLALGNIFTRVFESVDLNGDICLDGNINFKDAFVVTFALLALASPNRASAEIPLIPQQHLNQYSERDGEPVYYLTWIGSKGFKDYKNHILSALVDPVTRAINFFAKACEPARVLCRFYESPNRSLSKVLGSYKVRPQFKKNLDLSATANLFTVGYALGFYAPDEYVFVLKAGADITSAGRNSQSLLFDRKPIFRLHAEDRLSGSMVSTTKVASLNKLFGYVCVPKDLPLQKLWSVQDLQDWWLSYFRRNIMPGFPFSFSSGESSIKIKDALFCVLGNAFHGDETKPGSGGTQFQRSRYGLVRLSTLGSYASRRLTGGSTGTSIFEDYGFSSELCVRPHMLRHLANSIADVSGIPMEIITAWSGRKELSHTYTYIHTSHANRAQRVSCIMNPREPSVDDIRVVSQSELIRVTNLPATITSTGICTQSLNVTPCDYLNDFVSQCFMCPESCHIAADEQAIHLLEVDLSFQNTRLEAVRDDVRLVSSTAMQRWYLIHARNKYILARLIKIMKSNPAGTFIRYSNRDMQFSLTDLSHEVCNKIQITIPDLEAELREILSSMAAVPEPLPNASLDALLTSFGLTGQEV